MQAPDKNGSSRSDSLLLIPDSGLPIGAIAEKGKPNTRKAKGAHRVPEGFKPDLEFARLKIPDLDAEEEAATFLDWEFKTARSDWAAAWRTWIRNAKKRGDYARIRTDKRPRIEGL